MISVSERLARQFKKPAKKKTVSSKSSSLKRKSTSTSHTIGVNPHTRSIFTDGKSLRKKVVTSSKPIPRTHTKATVSNLKSTLLKDSITSNASDSIKNNPAFIFNSDGSIGFGNTKNTSLREINIPNITPSNSIFRDLRKNVKLPIDPNNLNGDIIVPHPLDNSQLLFVKKDGGKSGGFLETQGFFDKLVNGVNNVSSGIGNTVDNIGDGLNSFGTGFQKAVPFILGAVALILIVPMFKKK